MAAKTKNSLPRRAAILGGNRIPFARSNGPYAQASNQDMLTSAARRARRPLRPGGRDRRRGRRRRRPQARARLQPGARGRDGLARWTTRPPAFDVQQACDTGIQAAVLASNKIKLGQAEVAIAGGVDTTSDAPLGVNDDLRRLLVKVNASKSTGDKVKLLAHVRPSHLAPDIPRNAEPRTGLSMGEHAAITARKWNISREAQDELAATSHQRLAAAYDRGFFDDLVTPYLGLSRDQNLRPDSTVEKLAKLKPVFGVRDEHPTMTAANSTPLSDGASVVLLSTDEWADERRLPVLAHLTHSQTSAVPYVHGEEGLLMAPVYAVPKMLDARRADVRGLRLLRDPRGVRLAGAGDAGGVGGRGRSARTHLGLKGALGSIDRAKLNVNGSSLAAGHPFAATGGRILATSAKLLAEKGSGRALISVCAAGGQGVVAIVEREA